MLRHWSQFVPYMSTDVRGHESLHHHHHLYSRRAQELCESRGHVCPGLPPLITLLFLWTESNTSSSSSSTIKEKKNMNCPELRSCVKVEVVVLGSPSLISRRFLWTESNTQPTKLTRRYDTTRLKFSARASRAEAKYNNKTCTVHICSPQGDDNCQMSVVLSHPVTRSARSLQ